LRAKSFFFYPREEREEQGFDKLNPDGLVDHTS